MKKIVLGYFFVLFFTLSSLGNSEKIYFCTAANDRYYTQLINLIGSIHNVNFEELGEISVYNIGLSKEHLDELKKIEKVNVYEVEPVHKDVIKPIPTTPQGRLVPGLFSWKPVIIKQSLDMFPTVLYLDAGHIIFKPVNKLFDYIKSNGYFIFDCGCSLKPRLTKFVIDAFDLNTEDRRWIIDQANFIDASMMGFSRNHPSYEKYLMPIYSLSKDIKYFADDGTAPLGYGQARHDQTIFSIYAHILNLDIQKTDFTQKHPTILSSETNNCYHLYMTWHPNYVCNKTTVYHCRADTTFDHKKSIKLKSKIAQPKPEGYYSQCGEEFFVCEQFFKDKKSGIFIDIGAHNGVSHSNSYFFEKLLGWKGLCIEPIPSIFKILQTNRSCVCIQGCISNKTGKCQFLEITGPHQMLSGLIEKYDQRHLQRINNSLASAGGTKELIDVNCYMLHDITNQYDISHVDFLSIDTEGSELDILKTINFDALPIDVICVEVNYNDVSIKSFLESKGYKFIKRFNFSGNEIYKKI